MERRDHIATLCAAGTVGIAATGLAFGIPSENDNAYPITPGKRKWPGASSLKSTPVAQNPALSRRVVSQPTTTVAVTTQSRPDPSVPSTLFQRQSQRETRPASSYGSDATGSRGSSMNRSRLFRPRTADTRSTNEKRDVSANSSWLKRISIISSPSASSPSAASSRLELPSQGVLPMTTTNRRQLPPNKLVKRSMSQRALSNDHANGIFLRRPATSHQRSATVHEWSLRETSYSTPATPYLSSDNEPVWRPFFEKGYSRKRHSTSSPKEDSVPQTISPSSVRQPILILGSQIESSDPLNDQTDPDIHLTTEPRPLTGRQKLKRSLSSINRSSRRRHFTDPIVKVSTEAANGTITSAISQSPLSPTLQTSLYDDDIRLESPSFSSSPPLIPTRHRFSFRKRQSTAPSDPTTVSSDNDTRVFTDDDSMDFQSDTAYDSLTTRATVSSHSAFRTPKLDTVFADPQAGHDREADVTLARLVQKATLTDDLTGQYPNNQSDHLRGIGITEVEEENDKLDLGDTSPSAVTPIKSSSPAEDDYNMTPVPQRLRYFGSPLKSSPPVPASTAINRDVGSPEFIIRQSQTGSDEDDDIDWSPKSDKQEMASTSTLRQDFVLGMAIEYPNPYSTRNQSQLDLVDEEENDAEKRLSSIFDWSEHQKMSGDASSGMAVRPKTVHGKHGQDGSRSRSSGRKGPSQMHLRSQSVPNNRDPNAESTPLSTSKFGTWGLGHKPVSEEWSDDFEFDDVEEDEPPQILSDTSKSGLQGTLRGVRVPQAIIDRQASVHVQFGQVQEFMLLVEELRTLRARGAALHLLETHSRQLWDDAESIIDLATINNEDDELLVRPASPTSSDVFGDENLVVPRNGHHKATTDDVKRNSTAFRSVSSPATPPHGRPRGESLAHAKNFLQSIHQSRTGMDSSPLEFDSQPQRKLPFDTQDLKDLVIRSGVITRALKEVVRKAEGLSASPKKTPPRSREPAFSQIFNAPDPSPCPPFRKPGLPKSHSANSYLAGKYGGTGSNMPTSPTTTALIL